MAWGELLRLVARYLTDYLRHPEDGPYWWAINVERQHAHINTPMYHVTSWYASSRAAAWRTSAACASML